MKKIEGIFSNLVIPFQNTGDVDEGLFLQIVEYQIKNGIRNFIVNVANAEYPLLSEEEKLNLLRVLKEDLESSEDINIVFSIVINNMEDSIRQIKEAQNIGCDYVLLSIPKLPFKNKIGAFLFVKELVKISAQNIIVDISNVFDLSDSDDFSLLRKMLGLLEVRGVQLSSPEDLVKLLRYKEIIEKDFKIIFQNELLSLQTVYHGTDAISMDSCNIIPKQLISMFELMKDPKTINDGLKLFYNYHGLFNLFTENVSPIPVKSVLSSLKIIEEIFRLPLYSIPMDQKREIKRLVEVFDFKKLFKDFGMNLEGSEGAYKEI